MADSQNSPTSLAENEGTTGLALESGAAMPAIELTVRFPENGVHPVYFLA